VKLSDSIQLKAGRFTVTVVFKGGEHKNMPKMGGERYHFPPKIGLKTAKIRIKMNF
jgi:hypothetical protein